jgi:hypothetical protein
MAIAEDEDWQLHLQSMQRRYKNRLEHALNKERIKHLEQCNSFCDCLGRIYMHGYKKLHVLISSGDIEVCVPRIRCIKCNKVTQFTSALPDGLISATLIEKISDLSVKMSFQEVEESLYIQHGIRLSSSSIWRHMQKECESMEDIVKLYSNQMRETCVAPPNLTNKKQKIIIIGIDGGHISLWHDKSSFEMKAVTVCHGIRHDNDKSGVLIDRIGYASNTNGNDFVFDASALAYMHGLDKDTLCIVVSDGAEWIRKGVEDWFPNAIHVLDIFHLKLYINRLFGKTLSEEDELIRDDIIASVSNYDPDELIDKISNWNAPSHKIEQRENLFCYIADNAKQIENHLLISIHGSGMIEKGVDLMIARRFKLRGMSWTKQGSSFLIKMRLLKYNNQWNVYWNMRKGYKKVA